MKTAILASRIFLALAFIVVGLNGFFNFLPSPNFQPGTPSGDFVNALANSHWMTFISVFQIAGGVLLLIGGSAPVGLVILGAILANIVAFHLFLDGGKNLGPALILSAAELFLIFAYRKHFRSLIHLRPHTT